VINDWLHPFLGRVRAPKLQALRTLYQHFVALELDDLAIRASVVVIAEVLHDLAKGQFPIRGKRR
jgi:hypothetical protein